MEVWQNYPIDVEFAGLRGTTASMQSQGWQLNISAVRDMYRDAYLIRLAGKHEELRLRCISGTNMIDRHYISQSGLVFDPDARFMHFRPMDSGMVGSRVLPPFHLMACAEAITVHFPVKEQVSFKSINFNEPTRATMDAGEVFSLDDLCFFRTSETEADIYVPKKEIYTIEDSLQQILNSQKEKQKEIRERVRKQRELYKPEQEVKLHLVAVG